MEDPVYAAGFGVAGVGCVVYVALGLCVLDEDVVEGWWWEVVAKRTIESYIPP